MRQGREGERGSPLGAAGRTVIVLGVLGSLAAYMTGVELHALAMEGRKFFFAFAVFTILAMVFVRSFRIIAFSLFLITMFVYISDIVAEISGGSGGPATKGVSPTAGKEIFFGKGQCSTCHSVGGEGSAIRCPNLGDSEHGPDMGIRAIERGAATGLSPKEYLIRSIAYPDEWVVPGFTKGVMPRVWRPPVALTSEEVAAVIAYLQNLGGGEPDITEDDLPPELIEASGTPVEPFRPPPGIKPDPRRGAEYFHDLKGKAGCVKCHTAKIDGGHEIIFDGGLTLDGKPLEAEDIDDSLKALRLVLEKDVALLAYVETEGDLPDKEREEIEKVLVELKLEGVDAPGQDQPVRIKIVVPEEEAETGEGEAPPGDEGDPPGEDGGHSQGGEQAPSRTLLYLNDGEIAGLEALKARLAALRPQVASETRFKIYFKAKAEMDDALRAKIEEACAAQKLDFTLLQDVGPDLTGMAARQPWEYMLESMLDPSAAIAAEFQQTLLETVDEDQFVGILRPGESDDEVIMVVVNDEGDPEEWVIKKDEIEGTYPQPISPMPGNFKDVLTIEELFDILTFLLRLK